MNAYQKQVRALLSPAERRVFEKLTTPQKVQDFLDRFPINFERAGEEGIFSPRIILKKKSAQCLEGALFAAAALAYRGYPPLLMDFQTLSVDEDHVVALFRESGLWGAISKTNHAVLRWRDPLYRSPRELAASYFHEYYLWSGKKSLLAYSLPIDLRALPIEKWIIAPHALDWICDWIDGKRHFPLAPLAIMRARRKADQVELKALKVTEWPDRRKHKPR